MKIKFNNPQVRKYFFESIKKKYKRTWKELCLELNIPKYSLDRYKEGQILIPEELFLKLISFLNEEDKRNFLKEIIKLQDNFGQIKGGKKAYKINFKNFEEGRKKGLISIRENQKKKDKKIREVTLNIELSKEICEFMGAFIGDGFFNCYNNKLYQIRFSGDSQLDLEYYTKCIIPNIKKSFPSLNPHIYKVKNKNGMNITFYSRELFYYLKDVIGFTPGKKVYTVSIPEIILKNESLIYPTIRGIFDTDGGFYLDKRKGYKKPYPRIALQTVSKNLYSQLVLILSKEFKIYHRYNPKREIYLIELYGHQNIKKWMSLIGFSNKRHLDKIASVA